MGIQPSEFIMSISNPQMFRGKERQKNVYTSKLFELVKITFNIVNMKMISNNFLNRNKEKMNTYFFQIFSSVSFIVINIDHSVRSIRKKIAKK